jgi:hypothetical protein
MSLVRLSDNDATQLVTANYETTEGLFELFKGIIRPADGRQSADEASTACSSLNYLSVHCTKTASVV